MAEKTTVTVVDDIDGSEGARTIRFGVENGQYEIDLTDSNLSALYQVLDPYLSRARKVDGRGGGATRGAARSDLGAVREWAAANGYEVADRGRVPRAVLDAYEAR